MDLENIRLRIRHFLLQHSVICNRTASKGSGDTAAVSAMARELSGKIDLNPRRLQKYLAKSLPPKDLSITLTDLQKFAHLKGDTLSNFLAYLLEEKIRPEVSPSHQRLLESFGKLHEGHRRSLAASLFSGTDQKKAETIIDFSVKTYALNEKDIGTIADIIEVFHERMILSRQ